MWQPSWSWVAFPALLLPENCQGHPQKEEAYKKRVNSNCESHAYNAQANFWKNYEFLKKKMLMGSGVARL